MPSSGPRAQRRRCGPAAGGAPAIGGCPSSRRTTSGTRASTRLPVHAPLRRLDRQHRRVHRPARRISGAASTTAPRSASRTRPRPAASQRSSITFDYADESDPGPYRLPPDARMEGGGDRHVLVIDRDRCLLTEIFDATKLSPDIVVRRLRARSSIWVERPAAGHAGPRRMRPACRSCRASRATTRSRPARSPTRCGSRPSGRSRRTSGRLATTRPTSPIRTSRRWAPASG